MMEPGDRTTDSRLHLPAEERPVAIVTGGARRVGRALVEDLARRGYRLVVHAHESLADAERLAADLSANGKPAIALVADLGQPVAVEAMIAAAQRQYGRIDALVNCAAIWLRKPLEEVTPDDVRRHFEINTLGTFLCCQHVGLIMTRQSTGGAIVNIGDWATVRPYVDYSAYFPSKGAIPTLTRTLAVELARRNPRVRVNAILPGPVLLPDDMSPSERAASIAGTLLQREGTPQDVARAVAFLLESDFVTGVCLPVDGGRSIFSGDFKNS